MRVATEILGSTEPYIDIDLLTPVDGSFWPGGGVLLRGPPEEAMLRRFSERGGARSGYGPSTSPASRRCKDRPFEESFVRAVVPSTQEKYQ